MSRDDVKGWLGALWAPLAALVLVAVMWGSLGTRLSAAEAKAEKADDAINAKDGLRDRVDEIRSDVKQLRTILDERLPKKGP